jgi:hypothetical protein
MGISKLKPNCNVFVGDVMWHVILLSSMELNTHAQHSHSLKKVWEKLVIIIRCSYVSNILKIKKRMKI